MLAKRRFDRLSGNNFGTTGDTLLFAVDLKSSLLPHKAGGSVTSTFTRATTAYVEAFEAAAVAGAVPTWVACASGEARFVGARRVSEGVWSSVFSDGSSIDDATLKGYLAEGTRTNLVLQSNDFTVTWTAVGSPTNTAGDSTGGVATQVIGDDSAVALEGYAQTVTFTGNAVKAVSIVVKKGTATSSTIQLRDNTAAANRLLAVLTWSGTTPVVTMTTGTDLTGTPVQLGTSGKYRLLFATTSVTAANVNALRVLPAADAALDIQATGTLECGMVQAEDAAFPSSIIPTTTATVTRNADLLSYATSGNISNTAGTVVCEAIVRQDSDTVSSLTAGGEGVPLFFAGNQVSINDGGATYQPGPVITYSATTRQKMATTWTGSRTQGALNGTAGTAQTFDGSMNLAANFGVGYRPQASTTTQPYGGIRRLRIYSSALPDVQLQILTA